MMEALPGRPDFGTLLDVPKEIGHENDYPK